jgi:hypothetical protein
MSWRYRLLAALIIPYLIVLAFGYGSWEGRLISVGYLWSLLALLAGGSLPPSKQLVSPEAKLRQMNDKVVTTVVLCIRAAAIVIAVYLGFYLVVYLHDVYDIVTSRQVRTITGRLTAIEYGAWTWWCLTDVWVQTDGSLQDYQLFFYPISIEKNSDYVMHVLSRSTIILSLERSPSR